MLKNYFNLCFHTHIFWSCSWKVRTKVNLSKKKEKKEKSKLKQVFAGSHKKNEMKTKYGPKMWCLMELIGKLC